MLDQVVQEGVGHWGTQQDQRGQEDESGQLGGSTLRWSQGDMLGLEGHRGDWSREPGGLLAGMDSGGHTWHSEQ